jgi:hypothetical protein
MMKKSMKYLGLSLIVSFLIIPFRLSGQGSDCKVLVPDLTGTYSGECKNGLAHGKGTAAGKDRYEGEFNRGLPHGKGKYEWSDGKVYQGEWTKGTMDGKGEMTYHTSKGDSLVQGYWRNNSYLGKTNTPSYTIVRKDDLLSANLRKIGDDNILVIKFMIKGQINTKVKNLSMISSSGSQFKTGTYEGFQDVRFPVDVKITYTTSNPISRSSFDVVFECTINEAGKWEITLNN